MIEASSADLPRRVLTRLIQVFAEEGDRLNELDAKLGDGDHGLSMQAGLRGVKEFAQESDDLDLATFLRKGGMAFNEAAGSTIGILMFSAMKAAGQSVADKAELGLADAADMLEAATDAITARGKATVGQKTILDSLVPATAAMREAASQGLGAQEAAEAIVAAAREGAEGTAEQTSATGRARWFKERSVGIMDPGAWSGHLIVRTIAEVVNGDAG